MQRRWTVSAGAVALALVATAGAGIPTASAAPAAPVPDAPTVAGPAGEQNPAADRGLADLREDARGALRVHRDTDGTVDFVSSTTGRAVLPAAGTATASGPRAVATRQLARYGEAFGLDGARSRALVDQVTDSADGGSVVRTRQVVDGVEVFGGQVVVSLDGQEGLVSVNAATTPATTIPEAEVSEAAARRTALMVTARTHRTGVGDLTATGLGRRLYDPALVHVTDPRGVRPVWLFEVRGGVGVRETVLVGTGRGEVALHFGEAPSLDRSVCDNRGRRMSATADGVPLCADTVARAEGAPSSGRPGSADVDQAYDNLGASAETYAAVGGLDLTALVGATVDGRRSLTATVRWCFTDVDSTCPYDNAFWDGTQMVFGQGMAAADDVVGHELTHGYVERTSDLFLLHQSGAINESVADVVGEVVDHGHGTDDDSAWTMGEDLGRREFVRHLADPTRGGQPDRMGSPLYRAAMLTDDNGAVHHNDGVGNKTAHLISQGGAFNGQVVAGIDGDDRSLAKTGRLYLETIPRLTSGSQYADLGRVLASTCDQLAASSAAGFTTEDCVSVRRAVLATELAEPPSVAGAAPGEAPVRCPAGRTTALLRQDDDGRKDLGLTLGPLWTRTPADGSPSWAVSGTSSLFAFDPDPAGWGDPPVGNATTASFVVPATGTRTALNFHHAHVFEWYDADVDGPALYPDGARVRIQKQVKGAWVDVPGLPWINGPTRNLPGFGLGWGGDSHGYGSSEVDLSSLAGQTVRAVFSVVGDKDVSEMGWWVDDIRLYACGTAAPGAPAITRAAGTATGASLTWTPPLYPGSGTRSYRVTRSDGKVHTLGSAARTLTLTGVRTAAALSVRVAAVNAAGALGPAATRRFDPTLTAVTSSTTRPRKNVAFRLTARVTRRGARTLVPGMPVVLQRRTPGRPWSNHLTGTTSSRGTKVWSVRQSRVTSYRVLSRGATAWFGSTSGTRTVRIR